MIQELLEAELSQHHKEYIALNSDLTEEFIAQLERNIINNDNGIGLPYWAKRNPAFIKKITYALVQLGYATVEATSKFSRLNWNMSKLDPVALREFRGFGKFSRMTLRNQPLLQSATAVRSNGSIKETGLIRKGFAKVATYSFSYDTDMMAKYQEAITLNLTKSIKKSKEKAAAKAAKRKKVSTTFDKFDADELNFDAMARYCLDTYLKGGDYTLEGNVSDSRGRSIYKALKRIGNPISEKDFRGLITMPAVLVSRNSIEQMNDIYYFIAELAGSNATTILAKIEDGKAHYSARTLPILDLTDEGDRKDLHELIWLERIYRDLDTLLTGVVPFTLWTVPLEVDASMSVAQFVGAITNDERLLTRTNVIGATLVDPWFIEGVPRLTAKTVGTPVFYGSSQSATSLIRSKGLEVKQDEVRAIRKEFTTGGLAIMRQFKDALISNYTNHKPTIEVHIWDDVFNVEVNKFKQAGTKLVITEAWNGKKFVRSMTREPITVPDYDYMKLFWATCLV